jgi:rhodanese-related sulfurtransferase
VESTGQSSQTATGISLISVDELFQMTESDENIIIVDVRSKVAYQLSHIKGSISVPDSVISAGKWHQPDGKIPVLY